MVEEVGTRGMSEEEQKKKPKSGRGHFFVVDKSSWAQACELGMNPAVAYLILARGSLSNNVITGWSARAVYERTGIAHKRAAKAIMQLEMAGLVTRLKGSELERAVKKAKYSCDRRFLGKVKKNQVSFYRILPVNAEIDPIWLPNAIVDGAGTEVPPLKRIFLTSDAELLRLFVDLYSVHELAADGGIDREILVRKPRVSQSEMFEPDRIGGYGRHAVWRFHHDHKADEVLCAHDPVISSHLQRDVKSEDQPIRKRLKTLHELGLIQWVRCVLIGNMEDGELLFPCAIDGKITKEGVAANESAASLLHLMALNEYASAKVKCHLEWGKTHRPDLNQAAKEGREQWEQYAVVPKHATVMSHIEVAQLRYKPNTKMTGRWFHDRERAADKMVQQCMEIAKYADEQLAALQEKKVANAGFN